MGKLKSVAQRMVEMMEAPEEDRVISATPRTVAYNAKGERYRPSDVTSDFDRLITRWNAHAPSYRALEARECKRSGHIWARVMDGEINFNGWKICLRCAFIRGDERIPKELPSQPHSQDSGGSKDD